MPKRKSDGPVTLKEAMSRNVRTQQKRASATESPPEAKRPVRERVRTAEAKRKHDTHRGARP